MSPLLTLILHCLAQAGVPEGWDQAHTRGIEALLAGRLDEGIEAFERCLALQPSGRPGHLAYSLACAHARKGDTDNALDSLEKCLALGWVDGQGELDWISRDLDLHSLREEPRYQRILDEARKSIKGLQRKEPLLPPEYLDWNGGYQISNPPVEFSPDGRRIVSAAPGGWACLWDSESGELLLKLKHTHEVTFCSWVNSGRHLMTVAGDQMRLWDARTGELLRICSGPPFHLYSRNTPGPDSPWIVGNDPLGVRWFDIRTLDGARLYCGSNVYSTAISPDGIHFAAACANGFTLLFEAGTRRCLATHRSGAAVFDVTFSPDGGWLVTAGADGVLRWLDARTLEPARSFRAHSAEINSVRFRPGGAQLATASVDRKAKVWNAQDGSLRYTLSGHVDEVTWIAYSPDGKRLLTCGGYDDQVIRVWEADTGQPLLAFTGRKRLQQRRISFSPDGARLAVYDDRRARELDCKTGRELDPSGPRPVVRVRKGRSGLPQVVPCQESTWSEEAPSVQIEGTGVDTDAVVLSPDRHTVYSADADDRARLWNGKTGQLLHDLGPLSKDGELMRNVGRWSSACFSPDGALLATAQQADGATHLWETSTGEQILAIQGGYIFSNAVAFDRSGERLAIARGDWSVEVWNTYSHERLNSFKASDWPKFVAFRPDGAMLATGQGSGRIQLWDLAGSGGHRLLTPPFPINVCGLAFSHDGKRLASTAGDHRILIWDVEEGRLLGTTALGDEKAEWLAFAPSGHYHGTSTAIARARLVQGAIPYPLSCFAAALEHPEQVAASFAGFPVDPPSLPNPPTLVVDAPRERISSISERVFRLVATAVEPLAGLSGIDVVQDGASVSAEVLSRSVSLQDNERLARLELRLPIPDGASETRITLQAASARGIKSRPESFVVRYEPPKHELYVLALGVADYGDNALDLACPVQDVDGLIVRLQAQRGELFHEVHVERRVDGAVTSAEALRLRDEFLLQAKPDDTIVVFVAGHGVRTDTGEYWFLTSDATPQRPYSGIKRADLELLVTWDKLHATKRVLLLDTCHSGAAFGKGARGERGIAFQQSEVDSLLERSSGLYILAATSDDGFAREQEGNGLFTRALLDGLDGAADSGDFGDKDGTVGIDELMHFARYAVLERSAGRQQPTFPRIEGGENFPLARARGTEETRR